VIFVVGAYRNYEIDYMGFRTVTLEEIGTYFRMRLCGWVLLLY